MPLLTNNFGSKPKSDKGLPKIQIKYTRGKRPAFLTVKLIKKITS